jgi:hypothetical protein
MKSKFSMKWGFIFFAFFAVGANTKPVTDASVSDGQLRYLRLPLNKSLGVNTWNRQAFITMPIHEPLNSCYANTVNDCWYNKCTHSKSTASEYYAESHIGQVVSLPSCRYEGNYNFGTAMSSVLNNLGNNVVSAVHNDRTIHVRPSSKNRNGTHTTVCLPETNTVKQISASCSDPVGIYFDDQSPICINMRYPRGVKTVTVYPQLPNATYQWQVNGVTRIGNEAVFNIIHSWCINGTNTIRVRANCDGIWSNWTNDDFFEGIWCDASIAPSVYMQSSNPGKDALAFPVKRNR